MRPTIYLLIVFLTILYQIQSFQFKTSSITKLSNRNKSSTSLNEASPYKNFDDMLEKIDSPVLVDFYAQWCGPCKMMVPVLEDLANRLASQIKVAKVDTDKSPRLSHRYQVEALPTLILFNKGEIIEKFVGYRSADDLEREVKSALKRYNI